MHEAVEQWIDDLTEHTDEAAVSEKYRHWLDTQSRFYDYSVTNTLLIDLQRPDATMVASFRAWQEEFDRHVLEGEAAIWIWTPIVAKKCPRCGNSPAYHEKIECDFDGIPPEKWSKGVVGFTPTAVFDVSQTKGDPVPTSDTASNRDSGDLVATVLDAASALELDVQVVASAEWIHGSARGVCERRSPTTLRPVVEVVDRDNDDLARTLIREYAHAILHFDIDEESERSKREVEAESVAYAVGRHFDRDVDRSAISPARWRDEEREAIRTRLERISDTVSTLIELIERRSRQSEASAVGTRDTTR